MLTPTSRKKNKILRNLLGYVWYVPLAIYHRMKNSATKTLGKHSKTKSELGTSIRNDGQRNPMKTHNLINVDSCIIFGSISRLNGNKVGRFCQPIHNNHIESFSLRVRGNPTTKSILMASHFRVGTSMIWVKPPGFRCSTLTCGNLDT